MFIANNRCIKLGEELPLLTSAAMALCVALFLLINFLPDSSPAWLGEWGYFDSIDTYSGKHWGLILSAFLHVDFMHALFNLYWVWALGRIFEEHVGTINTLIFWIVAAFVSSGFQLAFSDDMGIGASGVVYALFGYLFVSRKHVEAFGRFLTTSMMQLFIIWLFVCLLLSWGQVLNIGNAAHFSGFVLGCASGWLVEVKRSKALNLMASAFIMLLVFASLLYAPWSSSWYYAKGNAFYNQNNYKAAALFYDEIPPDDDLYPYMIYLRAFAKDESGDTAGAVRDWENTLNHEIQVYPREDVLNNIAWAYATSKNPGIRDHSKSLSYATEANQLSGGKSADIIDTLATAYAANGNFDEAVKLQQKAIDLQNAQNEEGFLDELKARLELFKNEQPYIEN